MKPILPGDGQHGYYRYGTDKQGVPFVRYEDFVNGYDNSIPPQQASSY